MFLRLGFFTLDPEMKNKRITLSFVSEALANRKNRIMIKRVTFCIFFLLNAGVIERSLIPFIINWKSNLEKYMLQWFLMTITIFS